MFTKEEEIFIFEEFANFFPSLSPDFVKKCTLNIKKRAQLCVQQKGGNFEHF